MLCLLVAILEQTIAQNFKYQWSVLAKRQRPHGTGLKQVKFAFMTKICHKACSRQAALSEYMSINLYLLFQFPQHGFYAPVFMQRLLNSWPNVTAKQLQI